MKSTGVVRQLDTLGRIVLPIELRRTMDIGVKDMVEIFVEDDKIVLKKYHPACIFCGDARDELLPGLLPSPGRGRALEGQLEGGHGHVHLPAGQRTHGIFRLRGAQIRDGDAPALPGKHLFRDGSHLLRVHIAHHAQHHVRRMVEGPGMATRSFFRSMPSAFLNSATR